MPLPRQHKICPLLWGTGHGSRGRIQPSAPSHPSKVDCTVFSHSSRTGSQWCQKPKPQIGGFFIIINKAQNPKLLFWLQNRWLQHCQPSRCFQRQNSLCWDICSYTWKQKLLLQIKFLSLPFWSFYFSFLCFQCMFLLFLIFFIRLSFQCSQILRPFHPSIRHQLLYFSLLPVTHIQCLVFNWSYPQGIQSRFEHIIVHFSG